MKCCEKVLILPWCNRWGLGMDNYFHSTLYWACDYLSMICAGWLTWPLRLQIAPVEPNRHKNIGKTILTRLRLYCWFAWIISTQCTSGVSVIWSLNHICPRELTMMTTRLFIFITGFLFSEWWYSWNVPHPWSAGYRHAKYHSRPRVRS